MNRQIHTADFQGPSLGRRPGDEPVIIVANRRPPRPSAPTAEDRLAAIEGMARDGLDRLTVVAARLDKDA